MRRRPIQKLSRSPMTLIFGVIFNMTATAIYYYWLNEKEHSAKPGEVFMGEMHNVFWYTGIVLLAICFPMFILSVSLQPGYLTPFYDYTKLVEIALDIGLHLDNFCSYCEVIKSETSFHCTICGKCVEYYDHHCPFINNCLGYRNHVYFLTFIFLYTFYLLVILTDTMRHFVEIFKETGFRCLYTDSLCTTNLILITLHLPIFFYQIVQQVGTLIKKPKAAPSQFLNT